jgi:hypothetical protein
MTAHSRAFEAMQEQMRAMGRVGTAHQLMTASIDLHVTNLTPRRVPTLVGRMVKNTD